VSIQDASAFGIMSVDEQQRVFEFNEKPLTPKSLPGDPNSALASMGIYIFDMDLLRHELQADYLQTESNHDFGKDIIPRLIEKHCVCAYRFGGDAGRVTSDRYWRDVGTIDSYYAANMDLLEPVPPLNLYQRDWPIRNYNGQNPPARMVTGLLGNKGQLVNSMLGSGTVVSGGSVMHSILFSKVFVDENAVVEDSILFDGVTIDAGVKLKRCIVDKHVQIPQGQAVGFNIIDDLARFTVSESGVTVIPKDYQF